MYTIAGVRVETSPSVYCGPIRIRRWKSVQCVNQLRMQAAREVYLIEEHGSGDRRRPAGADPAGNMIIDIGGGTTEVAIISLSRNCVCRASRVAGRRVWTRRSVQLHLKRATI